MNTNFLEDMFDYECNSNSTIDISTQKLNIIGFKNLDCSIRDNMYLLKNNLSKYIKKINLIDIYDLTNTTATEMFYQSKFNWKEYVNKYQDLLRNHINNYKKAWVHAKNHGVKENRDIFQGNTELLRNFKIFIDKHNKCVYENKYNLFCIQPFELKYIDFTRFKYKPAVFWVWEFKSLPEIFKQFQNHFCKIYTVSNYCKTTFEKELTNKIEKINITSRIHEYEIKSIFEHSIQNEKIQKIIEETKDKIKIGYCFDLNSSIIRKNPFNLIKAFLKLQDSNKVLILKYRLIRSDNTITDIENMLINEFNNLIKNSNNIYSINEELSQMDLYKLYTYFDYYISTHTGEGFGITIYDNMILGNKIISPIYSGEKDYLNNENCISLDYEEKEIVMFKFHPIYKQMNNYFAAVVPEESIYNCLVKL